MRSWQIASTLIVLLLMSLIPFGCLARVPERKVADLPNATVSESKFAYGLATAVSASKHPDDNIVIGFGSLRVLLALLNAGASGETRQAIQTSLGAGDSQPAEQVAREQIAGVGAIARHDALWIENRFQPQPQFAKLARSLFGAEVKKVDFRSAATASGIAAWIASKSGGAISHVAVPPDTIMMAIDLAQLKAKWGIRFAPERSRSLFHGTTGPQQATLMSANGIVGSLTVGANRFVRIPLTSNSSMYFGVSRDGLPPIDIGPLLIAIRRDFPRTDLTIRIPKLQIRDRTELTIPLAQIGLSGLFNRRAAFPGIFGVGGIGLSEVYQESVYSQDEKGVAITTASIALTEQGPSQPFTIDRPFVFAVVDGKGTVQFAGRIRHL